METAEGPGASRGPFALATFALATFALDGVGQPYEVDEVDRVQDEEFAPAPGRVVFRRGGALVTFSKSRRKVPERAGVGKRGSRLPAQGIVSAWPAFKAACGRVEGGQVAGNRPSGPARWNGLGWGSRLRGLRQNGLKQGGWAQE